MAKKIIMVAFAVIVLCLCCGTCFAAENKNSNINLGNEIMQSVDKTGQSIQNVVSGNVVRDVGNTMNNTGNHVNNKVNNLEKDVKGTVNGGVNNRATGNYNTVRTTTEGTVANRNFSTMTTTTWMWIILVVAAIVIIAAIWYYATRNND